MLATLLKKRLRRRWNFLSIQFWKNIIDKFLKLSKKKVIQENVLEVIFTLFSRNCQNFHFGWPAGNFLLIPRIFGTSLRFHNFLTLLYSFGISSGNWDTPSLVIITKYRFSCYEKELCQNLKNSLYVLSKIVPFS